MSLRIGIDIQSVRDVEKSLLLFGTRYLETVYDDRECNQAMSHPNTAARYLAGRFAAREAVLKLVNTHDALAMWNDVLLDDVHRATSVQLRGSAKTVATSLGINEILLCIASTRDLATAVAVADVSGPVRSNETLGRS